MRGNVDAIQCRQRRSERLLSSLSLQVFQRWTGRFPWGNQGKWDGSIYIFSLPAMMANKLSDTKGRIRW